MVTLKRVEPLGKYVVVKCHTYEKTGSGLYLPVGDKIQKDDTRDLVQRHEVVAKGPEVSDRVSVGDFIRWRGGLNAAIFSGVPDHYFISEDSLIGKAIYEDASPAEDN